MAKSRYYGTTAYVFDPETRVVIAQIKCDGMLAVNVIYKEFFDTTKTGITTKPHFNKEGGLIRPEGEMDVFDYRGDYVKGKWRQAHMKD